MSNTPSNDEGLYREVDEELRREKLKELWEKFGVLAIGAAIALVVGVGGYKYFTWQAQKAAQNAGDQLLTANALVQDNKQKEAETLYKKLSTSGPAGYQALANLRIGALEAAKGENGNALKSYARVSENSDVDPIFREFATLQAAILELDKAKPVDIRSKLSTIADGKGAWRHMARELIGLSEYKAGQIEKAKQTYSRLLTGKDLPNAMKQRAQMMQTLLNAGSSATDTGEKSSSPKKK